jgi:ABC-2 type transport system ATP-binding protein
MTPVIQAEGLSKRYGDVAAVDGPHLIGERREIYAFVGPNGAGTITTIRMLLRMVRPSAGGVSLIGRPPRRLTRVVAARGQDQ